MARSTIPCTALVAVLVIAPASCAADFSAALAAHRAKSNHQLVNGRLSVLVEQASLEDASKAPTDKARPAEESQLAAGPIREVVVVAPLAATAGTRAAVLAPMMAERIATVRQAGSGIGEASVDALGNVTLSRTDRVRRIETSVDLGRRSAASASPARAGRQVRAASPVGRTPTISHRKPNP